jgi:hypothetical protein
MTLMQKILSKVPCYTSSTRYSILLDVIERAVRLEFLLFDDLGPWSCVLYFKENDHDGEFYDEFIGRYGLE